MVVKRESWILISLKRRYRHTHTHTHTCKRVCAHMCTSPVSPTCMNSIPTVSMHSHSLPCLLLSVSLLHSFSLPISAAWLPPLPPLFLWHIFLHPSPLSLPQLPSIFPFPTSRPTSLFIQACPSIPSSTHLSIHPIPHSLFPNPAERDPRHPVHPSLPCLRAPFSPSLFPPCSLSLWCAQAGHK